MEHRPTTCSVNVICQHGLQSTLTVILALLAVLSFVGFRIADDDLTVIDRFRLMWLSGCSIILATGLVYLNLAGQADLKSAESTPLTQLLLANLSLIMSLGLVLFFLSLAFF